MIPVELSFPACIFFHRNLFDIMTITKITVFAWSLLLLVVLTSPMQEYPDCMSSDHELGAIPLPSTASLPSAPSTTVLASGSPTEPSITTPSPGAFGVVDSGNGQATYYSPEVRLGSCGVQMLSTDIIAAAADSLMQPASNPNLSPHCCMRFSPLYRARTKTVHADQQVRLSKQGGTQTVTVAIMNTCKSCVSSLFAIWRDFADCCG